MLPFLIILILEVLCTYEINVIIFHAAWRITYQFTGQADEFPVFTVSEFPDMFFSILATWVLCFLNFSAIHIESEKVSSFAKF